MEKVKLDRFGRVLIPKRVRDRLSLTPGEELALGVEDGKVILERESAREFVVRKGRALVFDIEGEGDISSALRWQREKRNEAVLFDKDDA